MNPRSADTARVEEIVQRSIAVFKQSLGFRSCMTSVGALMGPGANKGEVGRKKGEVGRVVFVDFDTLEDALGALQSEDFEDIKTASEKLGPTHYLR